MCHIANSEATRPYGAPRCASINSIGHPDAHSVRLVSSYGDDARHQYFLIATLILVIKQCDFIYTNTMIGPTYQPTKNEHHNYGAHFWLVDM